MDLSDLAGALEDVLDVPCPAERIRKLERGHAFHGLLISLAAGGVVVLIATLVRKGVLSAGDLRETLLGDG